MRFFLSVLWSTYNVMVSARQCYTHPAFERTGSRSWSLLVPLREGKYHTLKRRIFVNQYNCQCQTPTRCLLKTVTTKVNKANIVMGLYCTYTF